MEEETRDAMDDTSTNVEHREAPETEPEQLPTDDGVDVDNEPELESELAALLGGTSVLAIEAEESAGSTKQEQVVEATSQAQEDAPVPEEEPVDATSETVAHEPVVEEAAVAASEATEADEQPVEQRVADVDPNPVEPAHSMPVDNNHSERTQPEPSTTTEHSKPAQAHEVVAHVVQGNLVAFPNIRRWVSRRDLKILVPQKTTLDVLTSCFSPKEVRCRQYA